jgi:uncharacterized protein (DUF1697 family)
MITYVSMIRGINVGSKRIKMDDLKEMYKLLGFLEVKTYIQSGNVIFKSPKTDSDDLIKKIKDKILEVFGYDVEIIIRTRTELEKVIENNPFKDDDIEHIYVTFLSKTPSESDFNILKQDMVEQMKILDKYSYDNKEIFLYLPEGYGRTKLNNNYFENKLDLSATTRNWKTVNKLLNIANSYKK